MQTQKETIDHKLLISPDKMLYLNNIGADLTFDQEVIADRVSSLLHNSEDRKKDYELSKEGYHKHSLGLMCTYYSSPFILFKGKIEQYPNEDLLQGNSVDLFAKDDGYVRQVLKNVRNKEGVASLVIDHSKELEGRYLLMYSGISLPEVKFEEIKKYYGAKSDQDLLRILELDEIGNRTKAMLGFSINNLMEEKHDLFFVRYNNKNYIISGDRVINLNAILHAN